jgi:hypothetical protein
MNKDKTPKIKKSRAKGSDIVKGLTCFKAHSDAGVECEKTECRYWQKMKEKKHCNCVILAAEDGPMTLQEVGDIFNVTRMRICQIEKLAKRFLKSSSPKVLSD